MVVGEELLVQTTESGQQERKGGCRHGQRVPEKHLARKISTRAEGTVASSPRQAAAITVNMA